jgi:hypothetical protein
MAATAHPWWATVATVFVRAVVLSFVVVEAAGSTGSPRSVPSVPVVAGPVAAAPRASQRNDSENTESNRECNHLCRPFENPG